MQRHKILCTRLELSKSELTMLDAINLYAQDINLLWDHEVFFKDVYTDAELKTFIEVLDKIYRAPIMYGKPRPEGFLQFISNLKKITRQNKLSTSLIKFVQDVNPALVMMKS